MKIQLEPIRPDHNSSFHIMVNPRLNDMFFWHFHPELELTYIEGTNGMRCVGDHVSKYVDSDLVFIGSNIPHLNFDYGIKGHSYEKRVLHIRPEFFGETLGQIPEMEAIRSLFEKSAYGVAVTGETKALVGQRMKALTHLSTFNVLLEVLNILHLIATTEDFELLHEHPVKVQANNKIQERIKQLYHFIEAHYQRKIEVAEVAQLCKMSKEGFCRYFKHATRLTFTDFLNQYRVNRAKQLLLQDKNVSEVCYETGFESLSYFNRVFKKITGINPMAYKKAHV
jgi:AraC-like DNA-binding protein